MSSGVPSTSYIPNPSRPGFYDSRGPLGISVCIAFSTFSFLVLLARLFTRLRIVHHVGVEDFIICISWCFAATFSALVVVQVSRGLGRHIWALTFDQYTSFAAPFWASICFYQATLTMTKISILLQYLQIFISGKVRRVCWTMFGVVIAYGTWSVISAIFMCTPVAYFWNKEIAGGHCLPEQPVWFGNGAMNIATDIAILILPMPTFSKLNLPKKQKRALMMILALGGVVCVISMVRFESLYVISVSRDVSWDNVPIAYWTAIECNIGIVCACLPSLKQLLSRFLPFLIHSGPGSIRDARQESRDAWEHDHSRTLNEACDSHALVTQVSGPDFARSVPGLTLPLKALSHTTKRSSGEFSPSKIEEGSIQVTTVIEQDVGDESDNSSHRQLVW